MMSSVHPAEWNSGKTENVTGGEEGDGWGVQREIKRIEKTGAYLRNWGVEPYFPRTLGVMREGAEQTGAGVGAGSPPTYS